MKKGKGKHSKSHSGMGKGFLIGFILGIIVGFMVGGSLTPTGNVVMDECDPLCGSGEECMAGVCMPIDNDYDGYDVNTDCNDNNANVYPGNYEMCGDSLDNDCDSSTPDTCPSGETCSAGACMDETIAGGTPPVQPEGDCTLDSDCTNGDICMTGYCMPDPNAGGTPPV